MILSLLKLKCLNKVKMRRSLVIRLLRTAYRNARLLQKKAVDLFKVTKNKGAQLKKK